MNASRIAVTTVHALRKDPLIQSEMIAVDSSRIAVAIVHALQKDPRPPPEMPS